jgi:hypothetical protein
MCALAALSLLGDKSKQLISASSYSHHIINTTHAPGVAIVAFFQIKNLLLLRSIYDNTTAWISSYTVISRRMQLADMTVLNNSSTLPQKPQITRQFF